MKLVQITDRDQLADYFKQDINLHLYSMGDLDDFYWPATECFGEITSAGVNRVILLYRGDGLPVLLALAKPGLINETLINQLVPLIPDRIYSHLSPGIEGIFARYYSITNHGLHYKMNLANLSRIKNVNTANTCLITQDHLEEVQTLFSDSYPGNAFYPMMINTGQYYGIWNKKRLVCVGGVHVYSQKYKVAALGNITTHPEHRNQGLGRTVTAKLCQLLSKKIDHIGLNVKADNKPGLHLYQSLGFQISSKYGEYSLKLRF